MNIKIYTFFYFIVWFVIEKQFQQFSAFYFSLYPESFLKVRTEFHNRTIQHKPFEVK